MAPLPRSVNCASDCVIQENHSQPSKASLRVAWVLKLPTSSLHKLFVGALPRNVSFSSGIEKNMTETSSSMKKLEGKVAIISGGASGIGEATVQLFVEHGVRAVVIADIQDELGRRLAESLGPQCSFFHCDVGDEEQVKAMVEWTVGTYGQLDIMFSNAGIISGSDQKVLDLDLSQLDRLFRVNVRGMAACVKHAARAMVERRVRGSIVCTASVAGSRGGMRRTDYFMSKHAVVGLMRSASRQLGEHGIRVNSVSPYVVATPLMQNVYQKEAEEVEKACEPFTSLKGIVLKVKHVADAVLFLASDDSSFVSGHDLVVDGALATCPATDST